MTNILFFILLTSLIGGLFARLIKIPPLVGYILAGVVGGMLFSFNPQTNQDIAEIGVILLLFSVGLEISLEKLIKVGKVAVLGGLLQITASTIAVFLFLHIIFNVSTNPALVLAIAFSFSSTALIVKIMDERKETETIHYQILTSWALVQDLAVIPVVVLLPTLTILSQSSWANITVSSIFTTALVLGIVLLTGKLIAPYLTHLVAVTNSHELLMLLAITLALGVAGLVSIFGISAAFGAFLAGVVISKTQENHAIFSETRPLRDIFSVLFFVSLGFLVSPSFIVGHILQIALLSFFVIVTKVLIVFALSVLFGYRGKTAVAVSLGLAQVGEFAFVLFILAQKLGILNSNLAQMGIATTLVTLLVSPFLFKGIIPIWRSLKEATENTSIKKLFVSGILSHKESEITLENHIIICGFGRMGRWVGKALKELGVDYIIIDYNHKTVRDAESVNEKIIYGDASFPEILDAAKVASAKAVIITIPDSLAQEEIIKFCQTNYPNIKIMARALMEEDIKNLNKFKIEKVVQPEFEAALAIVKKILVNSGHDREEVNKKVKALRLSHANVI